MKPHRIRMTHNLLLNYGLYKKMQIYVCRHCSCVCYLPLLLSSAHDTQRKLMWQSSIQMITLTSYGSSHQTTWMSTQNNLSDVSCFILVVVILYWHLMLVVNVGEDCPVFDGMFQFCQVSAGGSLGKLHARCLCKRACVLFCCCLARTLRLSFVAARVVSHLLSICCSTHPCTPFLTRTHIPTHART